MNAFAFFLVALYVYKNVINPDATVVTCHGVSMVVRAACSAWRLSSSVPVCTVAS